MALPLVASAVGIGLGAVALRPDHELASHLPKAERQPTGSSTAIVASAARDGRPPSVVPAQCYTKTTPPLPNGRAHNPCFTCHTQGRAPSYINDADLQTSYDFSPATSTNPYTNLFVDRTRDVRAISDDEILRWVRTTNYPPKHETVARAIWSPDATFIFDERGFDHRPDGTYTGWRAYAYYPLPGSFMPTNGSFDDALIRLPNEYRQREDGVFDPDVYAKNLDVLRDRVLAVAGPAGWSTKRTMMPSWVGRARLLQAEGKLREAAGLFPLGTEFLHSVRYLDVTTDEGGQPLVTMAPRMKELRYARKVAWLTYADHLAIANEEALEKRKGGDRLRVVRADDATGAVDNGRGWHLLAFIEDVSGELRPQTHRELAGCVGCHGGIGANVDSVISFQRSLSPQSFRGGWFHPSQRDLRGVPEPTRPQQGSSGAATRFEYTFYLEQNGAADDLRANDEAHARFFDDHGHLRPREVDALHRDVTRLLLPSPERALTLDKAYRVLVRDQSFEYGRSPTVVPTPNVHERVTPGTSTGIDEPTSFASL